MQIENGKLKIEEQIMSQMDVVAFLTCDSATRPTGVNQHSMIEATNLLGAKFSIGFTNAGTIGAEFFYLLFMQYLLNGESCNEAFEDAKYVATHTTNQVLLSLLNNSGENARCLARCPI